MSMTTEKKDYIRNDIMRMGRGVGGRERDSDQFREAKNTI
jgi:hypothetical protein